MAAKPEPSQSTRQIGESCVPERAPASRSEHWDDDRCPKSKNSDGSHCAHADTHDVCDWCGAHWGEGGTMTVPIEAERNRCVEIVRRKAQSWNAGTPTRNVLDGILRDIGAQDV